MPLLKGVGMKGDVTAVSARLVVAKSILSATRPDLVDLDRFMAKNPREFIDKLMVKA